MLSRPSFEHEFVVQTDASDSGLGAVLTQTIDGEEKVLCFASRTLNKAERNYSVTERECLAVLWAIQKFRPYVEGYRFRVITDHSSLRWLHNLRNPTGKLSRWSLELQQFDYIVEHRKGTNNVVPDALSRLYEDESDEAQVASIIINEKAEDSWYNKLLTKVKTDPTKYSYHKAIGSTLYHYRPDPFIDDVVDDQDAWKLIVPKEKRQQVLSECHEEPTAGHLGRHKTYQRLAMRYYWPSAHRDVTKYVRECQICQQCKVQQLAPAGLMGRRAITRPWSIVAGDTMGPFPRSAQGNEYIIIFMDLFTRWIEAIPVRKANARTIRKHLLERVFLRFGAPEVFHSDNGTEYKNNLVDEFLTERGVIHSTIPIYTANANPVERVNRTYKTMMISYIEENVKTWDEHIYELTFAFNTAVHGSTGVSPAFLNLGRNPEIGHSVRRKEAEAALIAEEDEARIAWAMRMENLSGIRDKATENSQQAQERQAQYYNKKRRDVTFKANDKVWRRNRILSSGAKGIAAKLKRRFRGPCKVSKVLGSNVYQLIGESGELVEKVTASDLKPCYGRSSTAESDERHSATANVTRVKSTTAAVSDERKSAATDVTSGELSATSNKNDGKIATKAKSCSNFYQVSHHLLSSYRTFWSFGVEFISRVNYKLSSVIEIMSSLKELVAEQHEALGLLSRAFTNLKKKGSTTLGSVETRQKNSQAKWNDIVERHNEIVGLAKGPDLKEPYFKNNFLENAEEVFMDEEAKFIDEALAIKKAEDETERRVVGPIRNRKLPTLQLPTFSGKYADWKPYKDLFQAIMKDATDITDVERFYYLNSSLTEDAAKTIKNLAVTEENYKRAWDRLVSHYDNKRALVHSALSELFTISPLTKESSKALRELRDPTRSQHRVGIGRLVERVPPSRRAMKIWIASSRPEWKRWSSSRCQRLRRIKDCREKVAEAQPAQDRAQIRHGYRRIQPHRNPQERITRARIASKSTTSQRATQIRALELGERKAFVQRNKLCFNCLGRHLMRDCRSNKSCKRCQGRHHSLLHMSNSQATADASGSLDATQDISVNTHIARRGPRRSILLATARIIVSASQRTMEVRALIDPCSEATFISEALEQQLRIPQQTALVPVTGVAVPDVRLPSIKHRFQFDHTSIMEKIGRFKPFSDGLKLADYNVKAADKVDVIIGADLFPTLIKGGLRRGPDSALIAQATELGWILTGATDSRLTAAQESATIASHSIGVDTELHELMERFWQQEDVAPASTTFTKEEQECEEHFVATHRRDEHGRYIVRLPFKGDAAKLGDSKLVAQRTLRRMERRFAQQPQWGRMYENFMAEYTSLNHMSELRVVEKAACEQFYLPHHGVLKQNGDKAKLRVVFNGSVKEDNGATLNDCLHVGPKLQTEIFDIMLRWQHNQEKSAILYWQLYDPLGWISPLTIQYKIFLPRLWTLGLSWDDPLPAHLQALCQSLVRDLQNLNQVCIPRWIGLSPTPGAVLELHGFADASERAYGAVIYVRTAIDDGRSRCTILASKTKVAPLKQVSLPRLELCAAHMLVLLMRRVVDTMSMVDVPVHLWSDSTIALAWIRGHPTQWKTYVANRVSDIQTTLPQASWHHIAGTQNPADIASRGASVEALCSPSLWMDGPDIVANSSDPWPRDMNEELPNTELECRPIAVHIASRGPEENEMLKRYSSLSRLLRVTARCMEFVARLRERRKRRSRKLVSGETLELTPAQIDSALKLWTRQVQELHFSKEIESLRRSVPLPRKSALLRLHPILDKEGLLRLGGRLQNALLPYDEKHPYVLPGTSFLSLLLARDAHDRTLHGGTQLTLSHLRRRFWITQGRALVKRVIGRCIRCWRYKSAPTSQLMGDLPALRVQRSRPFLHTGIDYAGPINIKCSRGRGKATFKGYIAVFVCLATRAVHLEVASGYSARDFLMVYRRFVARRGICATLSSDCGTNFIGADRELRELFAQAQKQPKRLARMLSNEGTEWRFNPPAAPHFGGIWEAAVKSTKFHLKRIIGDTRLTFEEFSMLLAQIEACLNSRPLQAINDDPTDLMALTPAHFLIGSATCTIPEPSTLDLSISGLSRLQMLRNMYEHFWTRWSSEYLQALQHRPKWQKSNTQIRVGQLCVIRSELTPPCKWALARITQVHPGKDGLVRVVSVKTATSVFKRPVTKLSILPPADDDSPDIGEGGRNVPDFSFNPSVGCEQILFHIRSNVFFVHKMSFVHSLFACDKNQPKNPLQICWRAATIPNYIGNGNNKVSIAEIDAIDLVKLCGAAPPGGRVGSLKSQNFQASSSGDTRSPIINPKYLRERIDAKTRDRPVIAAGLASDRAVSLYPAPTVGMQIIRIIAMDTTIIIIITTEDTITITIIIIIIEEFQIITIATPCRDSVLHFVISGQRLIFFSFASACRSTKIFKCCVEQYRGVMAGCGRGYKRRRRGGAGDPAAGQDATSTTPLGRGRGRGQLTPPVTRALRPGVPGRAVAGSSVQASVPATATNTVPTPADLPNLHVASKKVKTAPTAKAGSSKSPVANHVRPAAYTVAAEPSRVPQVASVSLKVTPLFPTKDTNALRPAGNALAESSRAPQVSPRSTKVTLPAASLPQPKHVPKILGTGKRGAPSTAKAIAKATVSSSQTSSTGPAKKASLTRPAKKVSSTGPAKKARADQDGGDGETRCDDDHEDDGETGITPYFRKGYLYTYPLRAYRIAEALRRVFGPYNWVTLATIDQLTDNEIREISNAYTKRLPQIAIEKLPDTIDERDPLVADHRVDLKNLSAKSVATLVRQVRGCYVPWISVYMLSTTYLIVKALMEW
ncbi:unnamed protein product [Trichogramma brassicae]|uniref:Integrase catalytic domain-containing protein n=1 Tax=Trichogramma brassicae TaxID=86971 RepID=A0A6H5IXY2_9HYME|nr:unnamed protein product [Trichogramma brassicae]